MPSRTRRTTVLTTAIVLFAIGALGLFAGVTQLLSLFESQGIHNEDVLFANLAGIAAWTAAALMASQPIAAWYRRRRHFRWILEAEGR